MSEFTVEQVFQAIRIMSDGQGDIQGADKYLRAFSKSPEAWGICMNVLLAHPEDKAITFHMLRTLKCKVLYDFISLTPLEVQEIQNKSTAIIRHYAGSKEKEARIQCALIVIYLYIYTYQANAKTLLEVLLVDFDCFGQQQQMLRFFFDVIETFPEELIDNKHIIMDAHRKQDIATAIKNTQMLKIIELLQQEVGKHDANIKFHILRAYKKWLEFMNETFTDPEAATYLNMAQNCPIFKVALECLNHEELQNKAVEVICAVISLMPKSMAQSNVVEQHIGAPIMQEVFKSFPTCQRALQDDLQDELHEFAKLYSKVGRKFVHQMLLEAQLEPFLQFMLILFCHPNSEEQSEELSIFWVKLLQVMAGLKDPLLNVKFTATFEALIRGCVDKCRVTPEILNSENPHLDDEKHDTRSQMKDIIQELAGLVKPHLLVNQLAQLIKTEFLEKKDWSTFEGCLYLMNGLIKTIILVEDTMGMQYTVEVLNLYLSTQSSSYFIMKTVFKTLQHAELIKNDMLPKLFQFLTFGINAKSKDVQKKATTAFEKICEHNNEFVLQNMGQFMDLIVNLQQVSNFDNILKGVANAILSSPVQVQQHYVNLCGIFAKNLAGYKVEYEQSGSESSIQGILKNLNSLANIVGQAPQVEITENKKQYELIANVYSELWPLLNYFMENLSHVNCEVAEKIVRLTKHTFRASYNSFSVELLTQVFQCVLNKYKQVPISSFVYAAEVSATVFYKYPEYRVVLAEAFESMCNITLQHLPKLQSFEEHPDLTEDFFGMLVRFGRYTPSLLLQSQGLLTLMQLNLAAIGIEHVAAAKSFYAWMEVIFKLLKGTDEMLKVPVPEDLRRRLLEIVTPFIPQYLSKLFLALRNGPSDEEVQTYIEDCVIAIAELELGNYKEMLQQVLEEGQQNLLTRSEKQRWLEEGLSGQQQYLQLYTQRSLQSKLRG